MSIKKEIPNLLTLGNLLSGCLGLVFIMEDHLLWATYCIAISLICDFLDGFLARLLNAYSEIGKQLDSLADMVSFGVLPSFMLLNLVEKSCSSFCYYGIGGFYKPYMVFALALASAYRLAKFNIDTRQTDQFIGVPTPANGLFIASIPAILFFQPEFATYFLHFNGLLIYAILMSYLMVSELPLMAFKFKSFGWSENQLRYIFLIFCVISVILFKFVAIPVIVIAYILLSGIIYILNILKK
ncbi:MAG: CDP-diacylglycerol--serine O-phosphatidyltransferase [Bacteroidota bacterium]|jgi:CDP-diacylglycerol--serine O-phosphatidyltransferase